VSAISCAIAAARARTRVSLRDCDRAAEYAVELLAVFLTALLAAFLAADTAVLAAGAAAVRVTEAAWPDAACADLARAFVVGDDASDGLDPRLIRPTSARRVQKIGFLFTRSAPVSV
jgi:hypothetical protein